MSDQVWTSKAAEDLVQGDIIPASDDIYALEVKGIHRDGDLIIVKVYRNLYREYIHVYRMSPGQRVPVALSGISHMDKITNRCLNQQAGDRWQQNTH